MKKLVTILVIAVLGLSAHGQQRQSGPFKNKKRALLEQVQSSNNFFKANEIFRPLAGKQFYNPDPTTNEYRDSVSFTNTYFTDGNINTVIKYDLVTGFIRDKIESEYDSKGLGNKLKNYDWDGQSFVFSFEDGFVKNYDQQGRLISAVSYFINSSMDTSSAVYFDVVYVADSVYLSGFDYESTAPGGLVVEYSLWKSIGSSTYNTASLKDWYDVAYDVFNLSSIDWNGEFAVERLFYVLPYDMFFDYADYTYSESGGPAEEGRITGTFTPSKDEQLDEAKTGILYTPYFRESNFKNQVGKITLSSYEDTYNPITQSFDYIFSSKIDYTYQQDNIVKEVYSRKQDGATEFENDQEIHYMDFQDVSGIAAINKASAINIFPNPANASLHFEVVGKVESMVVTDMLGKELICPFATQGTLTTADVSDLKTGFYVITVLADGKLSRQVIEVVR